MSARLARPRPADARAVPDPRVAERGRDDPDDPDGARPRTGPRSGTGVRAALLRRPILLWVLYLVTVTGIALGARRLAPDLLAGPHGLSPLQVGLQVVLTALVVPFAAAVGAVRLGLTRGVGVRDGGVLAFPAATVAAGYLGGLRDVDLTVAALAVASVVLVGVSEELAFRGVLLRVLLPRGTARAVVVSSALFGLLHLANLALGASWRSTVLGVVFAGLAGAGYAAMRLRTGSLWPPIVLHAAYDATFRLADVPPGSAYQHAIFMVHGVGWALYAVVVLRRATC